jgi:hypothetical protein
VFGGMPTPPARPSPEPTDDERRVLGWLRKALRIHLVSDRRVVLPDLGEKGTGDDEFILGLRDGLWTVVFVERGQERPTHCYFDSVSDAAQYLFHVQTARAPINFQLDACAPEPY